MERGGTARRRSSIHAARTPIDLVKTRVRWLWMRRVPALGPPNPRSSSGMLEQRNVGVDPCAQKLAELFVVRRRGA
jgi:hypothetical protein